MSQPTSPPASQGPDEPIGAVSADDSMSSAATAAVRLRAAAMPLGLAGAVVLGLVLVYTVGGRDSGLITQSIVTGLLLGGVYALVSIGLTLIFGVLGVVNFAQGSMLTLSMFLVYVMVTSMGIPVYVATAIAIPVMFAFGATVQTLFLNKLTTSGNHEGPLLITLGVSLLIINGLLMVFGGRPKSVPGSVDGSITIFGAIASYERLIAFGGAAVVAVILTLALKKTSFGLSIRAVSANSQAASLVGVNVNRVYAMTFGIGAACVAVAGGLTVPFLSLTPTVGEQFTILAFVIVVLGGLGNVAGAMVGGAGDRARPDRRVAVSARDGIADPRFRRLCPRPLLPAPGPVRSHVVSDTDARHGTTPVAADDPRLRDTAQRRSFLTLIVLTAVLAVLPLFLSERVESIAIRTMIFAIMAVGWNLMSGYGGMFSFGHAAFFGIGAYTDAYLLVEHGISPWIAMVVGAAISAAAGTLIAFLCLRYKLAGSYFALATFAFAQMFLLVVQNLDFLRKTLGYNIPILPRDSWAMMQFEQGSNYYFWIPLGILVLALAGTIAFVGSRAGQYTQAIRDDEAAAASLGIRVLRYRLIAVALSCAVTSLAGSYYTQYYFFVGPDQAFGSSVSIEAIIPAVIGGIGTIWGPVVGAMVVGPLSEFIASILRNPPGFLDFLQGVTGLDVAVYAALLIVIVLFMPKGIYGTIRDRWRK